MSNSDLGEGFSAYLSSISAYKSIPWEEQLKLFKEYKKTHDLDIRERLITSNLAMVVWRAREFHRNDTRFRLDDLISVGNMGLMRAIDDFNPTLGYKFSTYAVHWIDEYMRRFALSQAPISPTIAQNLKKLEAGEDALNAKLGRYPTDKELSEYLGKPFSEDKIASLRGMISTTLSLDSPLEDLSEDANATTALDQTPDDEETPSEAASQKLVGEELEKALETLTPQEKAIIKMRNGLNFEQKVYTLTQVGDLYGVSKQRIKQIEDLALRKLRTYFEGTGGTQDVDSKKEE